MTTSRTVPALDGIRGLAILSVAWFHFLPAQMPGGWMGMSIFFPLSGFLVTRLLLADIDHRSVAPAGFWQRRAWRLFPALWVMLFVVALVVLVHGRWDGEDTGAVVSSLLYVNNWWQLGHAVDYWAALQGGASPFEHLWSLSVEEQFYLVWPLVAWWVSRRRNGVTTLGRVAIALAVGGTVAGLVLGNGVANGTSEVTSVYYHTFVRAAELMAGGATAVWMHRRTNTRRRLVEAVAILALAIDVVLWFTLDDATAEFVGRGGMALSGVGTCFVMVAAMGDGPVAGLLSVSWLRWLGTRCYSLYLWHWPVVVFVDRTSTGLHGAALLVLRVALTLAAAVLSHWLVEERFRRRRHHAAASPLPGVDVGRVGIEPTTDGL